MNVTRAHVALLWIGIGLFDATRTVLSMKAVGMHHFWTRLYVTLFLAWLPWALATEPIMYLGRRYPLTQFRLWLPWLVHLAACAGIGLISSAWTALFELLLNPWAESPAPSSYAYLVLSHLVAGSVVFLILYAAILAFSYMAESSRRLATQKIQTAQLSEQLLKAQLNALQRQIEPHFLFNTLNAIAGLVREKRNDSAVDMIAGLSGLLRQALEDSSKQQVPLAEEMEFVQKYLDIQKLRFADRLQLSVLVPEELFPAQVPRLILQPMVENAFKHGISKRAQGGAIRIAASCHSDILTLSVYNDGPKLSAVADGIGMSNLRARLKTLYGEGFELSLHDQEPGGVAVSVSMPFRVA